MAGTANKNKAFMPAFRAFSNLAHLANSTPEKWVARHKSLSPEGRSAELQDLLQRFQSLSVSNDAVAQMAAFLSKLNECSQIEGLRVALDAAMDKATVDEKFTALKAIFTDKQAAIAAWWEQYIASQNNMFDKMSDVLERNSKDAGKAITNIDEQGNYDPTKKIVRDTLRILFMLFDLVLVAAGHEAVFAREGKQQDEGRLDTKTGLRYRPDGVHLPGHSGE